MNQNQHRISQVYLKQFGYKDKQNRNLISVLKLDSGIIDNVYVKSFSIETNIFDLPFDDLESKRIFEDTSCKIETRYPYLLKNIQQQIPLSDECVGIYISFIANLLCRSEPFRKQVEFLFNSDKRDYFLSEITYYLGDKGEKFIKSLDINFPENQLNIILCSVWDYIGKKLASSNFSFVILKDYANRGWISSDNPVVIMNNINKNTILSNETEIILPLSKDYCLYIDNVSCKNKANFLRGKDNREIVDINEELFIKIVSLISGNAHEYIIFPAYLPNEDLSKDSNNKL